jgi:hypothetical protein
LLEAAQEAINLGHPERIFGGELVSRFISLDLCFNGSERFTVLAYQRS